MLDGVMEILGVLGRLLSMMGFSQEPSGYTSAPVTKVRGSDQYQLKQTCEPYQPPRPYKEAPHSRRDATDIINEETFGSSESSSQDRAEEEKKRLASIEQFRKEQKSILEKQKQFPDKHKEHVDPDMTALLANSEDDKKRWEKNVGFEIRAPNGSEGDSSQCSFTAQTHAPRPLVPPGFTGTTLEKNPTTKSSISHPTLEDGNGRVEQSILSEFSDNSSSLDQPSQARNDSYTLAEKRPELDNHAFQHLLSLLQKGTSANDSEQSHVCEPLEDFSSYKANSVRSVHKQSSGNSETEIKSDKNLTLETLFGSAFMNELQSAKAPVSAQRGSIDGVTQTVVLDSQGFPDPDDGFFPFMSRNSTLENDTLSQIICNITI